MPSYLDLAVLGVILVSALLSLMRGFTREVLAIASWGAARGFLLAVIAFSIFNWLVAEPQQPEWVRTAKTRPALLESADKIIAMLPEDAATTLEGWVKSKNAAAAPAEEPPDQLTTPPATVPAASPAPAAATTPTATPTQNSADKQKLDTLINKGVPLPSPAAPAVLPSPRKT
jgi:membrane protein required for colicin V production